MVIKVLGAGCARCGEAENTVREAIRESGVQAEVEKVTDFKAMLALGVMSTPAVLVDGKIMCTGHVPAKEEVLAWIAAAKM